MYTSMHISFRIYWSHFKSIVLLTPVKSNDDHPINALLLLIVALCSNKPQALKIETCLVKWLWRWARYVSSTRTWFKTQSAKPPMCLWFHFSSVARAVDSINTVVAPKSIRICTNRTDNSFWPDFRSRNQRPRFPNCSSIWSASNQLWPPSEPMKLLLLLSKFIPLSLITLFSILNLVPWSRSSKPEDELNEMSVPTSRSLLINFPPDLIKKRRRI